MNHKRLLAVLPSVWPCWPSLWQRRALIILTWKVVTGSGPILEADGFEAGLSFGIMHHFMGAGIPASGWMSRWFSNDDVDIDEFKIGGGGHIHHGGMDLVLDPSYVDEQITGKAKYPGDSIKSRIKEKEEGYEATFRPASRR